MSVNCGSEPPNSSMAPHQHQSPSICLLPIEERFNEHTQRLQEITFGFCLPFFYFFQGQKPGLTDVQAELDRMTRKQDSMVSTNNIPAPTENEA